MGKPNAPDEMTGHPARQHHHVAAGREVELKLAVPIGAVDAILERLTARAAADQPPRCRHQVTTYFDTSDEALARSGLSLRVRCTDGRHIQTLKADRASGVAADRAEFEWPVATNEPDLELAARTPLVEKLPFGSPLEPVVITDIRRTAPTVTLDAGTVVEAALDVGVIKAGDAQQPVRELELELKQGDPAPLFRFAMELHAAVPFTIESESKAARGYRIAHEIPPAVEKAGDVALDPRLSGAEAFRRILDSGLGHLLANQPAALAGNHEGVHQMRVAVRRLRTALTLFAPHLEPYTTGRFTDELRRIGRVFGEARDWDVFCLQILPRALDAAGAADWCALLRPPAEAERDAAHRRFADELRAPPFTALVLGLAAWSAGSTLGDAALDQPIEDLAPHLLDRLARTVMRRGRRLAGHSGAERHALRKSLKKLRYAIDDLAPIYSADAVDAYLRRCRKLQKTLGDMNDAVTAPALADGLAGGRPDLAPAVGALTGQLAAQREAAMPELLKRWKRFRRARPFWA